MARKRVIVDTNIIFSAIFYKEGNEYKLFDLADKNKLEIVIMDYVFDECDLILKRKGIDPILLTEFLETFNHITLKELEPREYNRNLKKARELIRDAKDVPIFIFAEKEIRLNKNTYLVTGDKDFQTKDVESALDGRVFKSREFLTKFKMG